MYKAAVMGDYESICAFGALGLEVYPCEDKETGKKLFKKLCGGNYAVVYITEGCAKEIEEDIEKTAEAILPAVILIPGVKGNTGDGIKNVKKSVEKAVGSDIIFNE